MSTSIHLAVAAVRRLAGGDLAQDVSGARLLLLPALGHQGATSLV